MGMLRNDEIVPLPFWQRLRRRWRILRGKATTQEAIGIKGVTYKDGMLELLLEHGAFVVFCEHAVALFDGAEGANYLSLEMWHPKRGKFEVLIRPFFGKTPAAVNTEYRKALTDILSWYDDNLLGPMPPDAITHARKVLAANTRVKEGSDA